MKYTFPHDEVRWGVIGAGSVCRVKSAPAMNKIPGSRIVAVMRRNSLLAKEYARQHAIPKWYDNVDKLIGDKEVNAVYVATPPHVHAEIAIKAAEAGKPVYVEKPMARTWKECQEMIRACEKKPVPLFVAYYRRMLPNYRMIRRLIRHGVIGEVRSVHIQMNKAGRPDFDRDPDNWRVDPAMAGGGYFYDLACHQLDFLDYLLGPVESATGFSANQAGLYKAEDIVAASFRFQNGALGTGNWCFTASLTAVTDRITLTGSKGAIIYPSFAGYYFDLIVDSSSDDTRKMLHDATQSGHS